MMAQVVAQHVVETQTADQILNMELSQDAPLGNDGDDEEGAFPEPSSSAGVPSPPPFFTTLTSPPLPQPPPLPAHQHAPTHSPNEAMTIADGDSSNSNNWEGDSDDFVEDDYPFSISTPFERGRTRAITNATHAFVESEESIQHRHAQGRCLNNSLLVATTEHKQDQNMHAQGSCFDPLLIEDSENEGEAVNEGNENEADEDDREPLPDHHSDQLPEMKTLQSQDQLDKVHIAQRLTADRDAQEAKGIVSAARNEILNPEQALLMQDARVVKYKRKLQDAITKRARIRGGPARMGPTIAPPGLEVELDAICHTSMTDLLELQTHTELIEDSAEYLNNIAISILRLSSKFRKAARHSEEIRASLMRKAVIKANEDANKSRDIYTNSIIYAYRGSALQGYELRKGQDAKTPVYVIKRTDGPVFHHKKCCKPNEEWERCKKKWVQVQKNGKRIYDTATVHFRDKWRTISLQDALDLGKRECTDNCCKNIDRNPVDQPLKKKRKAKK
jgi:hypothetical protein